MLKYLVVAFVLLVAPASAQQQPQTPPEIALQMNGIIGTWAQTLVQQASMIADLQRKLTAAEARIQDMERKPEKK